MIYKIYHIPGVKIGCSTNPKKRVKEQGYSDYEILEEYIDIYEVSDREIQLQKQYGYKVDTIPYWKSHQQFKKYSTFKTRSLGGQRGGATNVKTGHAYEMQKIGCRIGGRISALKQIESGELHRRSLISAEKNSIPIIATNIKTGEILHFKSMAETAKAINSSTANIVKLLKYKKGKTIKGFTLQYA
jgi:hypothetical protein